MLLNELFSTFLDRFKTVDGIQIHYLLPVVGFDALFSERLQRAE